MRTRVAAPSDSDPQVEEYELPRTEAVLAGTLALMTGYSQALQAAHDPAQRLLISLRIAHNLERLAGEAALSGPFRALGGKLATLWQQMARCTADAGAELGETASHPAAAASRQALH